VRRAGIIHVAPLLLAAACGKLQGFDGEATPLVSFQVVFHGDLAPLRPPGVTDTHALRVALVWGAQWLTEPFCVLPPESPEAAAVIAAGCRDPFGFVPNVVSVGAPIVIDEPATLTLSQLPAADVLVGDVTARVAYASLVVFDDRNDTGTLDLWQQFPSFINDDREGPPAIIGRDPPDIIYGASFVTMTEPDRRVAYREGDFDDLSAFYPRAGCDPPTPGFSVLAAGGFTAQAAVAALLTGGLPQEDPSLCTVSAPDETTIAIDARPPADVHEIGCQEIRNDSSVHYLEPPPWRPDLANGNFACAHLPTFDTGSAQSDLIQLVVPSSGPPCKFLTHYTLRGCREDVNCAIPDWDFTASPPAWWPCGP